MKSCAIFDNVFFGKRVDLQRSAPSFDENYYNDHEVFCPLNEFLVRAAI